MSDSKFLAVCVFVCILPLSWSLFSDMSEKVDLFLLTDFKQAPKWYAHYWSYYISMIVSWIVIFNLSTSKFIRYASGLILTVCCFRLLSYTLVRFSQPMISFYIAIICILVYKFLNPNNKLTVYLWEKLRSWLNYFKL